MADESKAIQKFISNDEQRLALLQEYNPSEHLLKWQAKDRGGKYVTVNYYPASWRLYELRLRYPTAKFDINIILMDQERNFCVVQAKLYVGLDYETAEIRSIAHKQGFLTELDRVETKAKARAARDLGISTELALDFDDTPEGEPVQNAQAPKTTVTEERSPQQPQSRQVTPQAPQLDNESKARLNSLFERVMALRVLKASTQKAFLMWASEVLGEAIMQPSQLAGKIDKLEQYIVGKEKDASGAQEQPQEAPVEEVVEA
jgi:hypothetical protein